MAAIDLLFDPDYDVAPGETLRDTLTALEMTQVELATRTGLSLKHVNQIIQGVAPVTPDTALLLEKTTGRLSEDEAAELLRPRRRTSG